MGVKVLTCGVFPDMETVRKKMWIFFASCKKFGIEPEVYGVGRVFPGYIIMKLEWQLEALKQLEDEYVLYTDGWDAFFAAGLDEVWEKYTQMGKPPLLSSAFFQLGNCSDAEGEYPGCWDHILYRYPNVGGWMGERKLMIEMFERMLKLPRRTGDDCFSWYDAWQEGWFRPQLDSNCYIFQVSNYNLSAEDGRLINTATATEPCVIHISGGYTDQVTGKDAALLPWAQLAGVGV